METTDIERIKSLVAEFCLVDERGCWIWTRSTRGAGYAQITLSGRRQVNGSRAAYFAFHGPIPHGMYVCHTCDVPACCNPKHLFLGSPKDNMRDCVVKGRLRPGRVGGTKKLTQQDIERVYEMRSTGMLQREIGEFFGVSQVRVSQLLSGKA